MSLLTVEATNFLILKHVKVDVNKQCMIVLGNSGTGKSTFSKIIRCHMGIEQYPANPLLDGENEGETKTTHQAPDGRVYSVSRKYVREKDGSVKLDRFEVRGPAGKEKSLEYVMENIFHNPFSSSRFDYNTFFNKKKGTAERTKYFIEAIGDKTIETNLELIEVKEGMRAALSGDLQTQKALYKQGNISEDPDEAKKQLEHFQCERTIDEAGFAKDNILIKKHDLTPFETKYNDHIKAVEAVKADAEIILGYKNGISDIDRQIRELQERRKVLEASIESREETKKEHNKGVISVKNLEKMLIEADKKEQENQKIALEAEAIYNEKVQEIIKFQTDRNQFYNGLQAWDKWQTINTQWNALDKEIKNLKTLNELKLKELLPLPELSIGEKIINKETKPIILYKGREFSDEFLSTGEQIEISAAIQVALNPTGDNFIIIPNAQDLGSKLKEVQAACNKFNVQYLVEMTKPDEEFRVELIDSEKETVS